jgi:hypothetical protein
MSLLNSDGKVSRVRGIFDLESMAIFESTMLAGLTKRQA